VRAPFYGRALAGGGAGAGADRVRALFAVARARGLAMREWPGGVPLAALRRALAPPRAAAAALVVLVDLRHLACTRCALAAGAFTYSFAGHYVLLLAHHAAGDLFEFVDPAVDPRSHADGRGCTMTAGAFDAARAAPGTDDDVIVLPGLDGDEEGMPVGALDI
jgi:hypothetical protein